jgi:hypothetical protein
MKRSIILLGMSVALTAALLVDTGNSMERAGTGTTASAPAPRKILPQALTDAECTQLGCSVHLDGNCTTDFGDGVNHMGHRCVCSSGSMCIDRAH